MVSIVTRYKLDAVHFRGCTDDITLGLQPRVIRPLKCTLSVTYCSSNLCWESMQLHDMKHCKMLSKVAAVCRTGIGASGAERHPPVFYGSQIRTSAAGLPPKNTIMQCSRLWGVGGLSAELNVELVPELSPLPAANSNGVGKLVRFSDFRLSVAHVLLNQWGWGQG